jgi:CBS domain-containing protein
VVGTDDAPAARTYRRKINRSSQEENPVTMSDSAPRPGATDFPLARYSVLNALQLDPIECPADADVRTIAGTMAEHAVHCVVVRDIEPGVWGVVSDLDLMAAMRPALAEATAAQLAATDLLIVNPADTLEHAAQLMAEHQTTHAIVVDPATREPVGIISTLDVARWAAA